MKLLHNDIDFMFKVVLTGPGAVGKTSLLNRYITNSFQQSYKITIGVDFVSKTLKVDPDLVVRMTIWDIGGQERFRFMAKSFYEGAHGALLVFDLSRTETFYEMQKWLGELFQSTGPNIPFLLIGNKLDLIESTGRCIDVDEIIHLAVVRSELPVFEEVKIIFYFVLQIHKSKSATNR